MFDITAYTVERIKDQFGILSGNRYEFMLEVEVDEEDELHSDNGLLVRVVFKEEEGRTGIVKYELLERTTHRYLEFELEPDELEAVESFCRERYPEADE
ncbi:DUF6509 family protein [Paenibacillus sp. GYB003]|uniref:DUF6509 family protein n=1 Tax=Paenibacillus sp. GYB003 TaxID=2994392 RepID=UPI002F96185B